MREKDLTNRNHDHPHKASSTTSDALATIEQQLHHTILCNSIGSEASSTATSLSTLPPTLATPVLSTSCSSNKKMIVATPTTSTSNNTSTKTSTVMEKNYKLLLIEELCKNLSVLLARSEIDKHHQHNETETNKGTPNDDDDSSNRNNNKKNSVASRFVRLSKTVMEFIDYEHEHEHECKRETTATTTSSLTKSISAEQLDRIITGCLLNIYRVSSVVNGFPGDTMAFFDWWRKHIFRWITVLGNTSTNCQQQQRKQKQHYKCNYHQHNHHHQQYNNLGWKHLKAMVSETRDHLSPPPYSYIVSGAGSQAVNGRYTLSPEFLIQTTAKMTAAGPAAADADAGIGAGQEQQKHHRHEYLYEYEYYGRRLPQVTTGTSNNSSTVTYEMVSPSPITTTTTQNNIDTTNVATNATATPTTTTISLCRCDMSNGHTSSARNRKAVWFLTELDEEQPNTDCDKDFYYAPIAATTSENTRTKNKNKQARQQQQQQQQKLPPTSGWTKCPGRHGVFPAPTVVAEVGGGWGGCDGYGSDGNDYSDSYSYIYSTSHTNTGAHADTAISYRDKLAEWIIEQDLVTIGIGIGTRKNYYSNSNDEDDDNCTTTTTTRDEGISSCLDFLMELYEEEENNRHHGSNEHKQQQHEQQPHCCSSSSSSLGTEFLVNFASWCLSFRQQQRQRQH